MLSSCSDLPKHLSPWLAALQAMSEMTTICQDPAGCLRRLVSEHCNTNLNPDSKPKEFWTHPINLEWLKGAARNYLQHPRMAWAGRDLTNHPALPPSSDMGTGWRWLSLHSFLLTAGLQWVTKTPPPAGTSCDAPWRSVQRNSLSIPNAAGPADSASKAAFTRFQTPSKTSKDSLRFCSFQLLFLVLANPTAEKCKIIRSQM